jgi:hypothetical protein
LLMDERAICWGTNTFDGEVEKQRFGTHYTGLRRDKKIKSKKTRTILGGVSAGTVML